MSIFHQRAKTTLKIVSLEDYADSWVSRLSRFSRVWSNIWDWHISLRVCVCLPFPTQLVFSDWVSVLCVLLLKHVRHHVMNNSLFIHPPFWNSSCESSTESVSSVRVVCFGQGSRRSCSVGNGKVELLAGSLSFWPVACWTCFTSTCGILPITLLSQGNGQCTIIHNVFMSFHVPQSWESCWIDLHFFQRLFPQGQMQVISLYTFLLVYFAIGPILF